MPLTAWLLCWGDLGRYEAHYYGVPTLREYYRALQITGLREHERSALRGPRRPSPPAPMAARVRQERFFAAAKAKLVRRGEWARPKESEAAVGWNAWDPPVDADQVHVVPSLLGITPTSRWLDSVDESEDEDWGWAGLGWASWGGAGLGLGWAALRCAARGLGMGLGLGLGRGLSGAVTLTRCSTSSTFCRATGGGARSRAG